MLDRRILIVLVALGLSTIPTALSWGAKGGYEPDTLRDLKDGFMWHDADTDPRSSVRKVYFNLFSGATLLGSSGVATSFNPNLASQGTAIQTQPFQPYALLGIWKDCNGDGYVGMGDNGLLEYRNELLTHTNICPPTLMGAGQPLWQSHNDGEWVREFVPIGYDDVRNPEGRGHVDENPYNLNDTTARVWADWGLPGDPVRISCSVTPMPHGTLRSTGGLLRWGDCASGYQTVAAINTAAHASGQDELAFDDAPRDRPDQSGSQLNRPNPYGKASDAPVAEAFDCSAPPMLIEASDPTDPGDGSGALHEVRVADRSIVLTDSRGRFVSRPVPTIGPSVDPQGSPAGTINHTERALLHDCRSDGWSQHADLAYSGLGLLEGANEPASVAGRAVHDMAFVFNEGNREQGPAQYALGRGARAGSGGALLDNDLGAGAWSSLGLWSGVGVTAVTRNPWIDRDTMNPEAVLHVTAYAYVSPTLLGSHGIQVAGDLATYGSEGCSRTPQTFVCDENLWWRDSSGGNAIPRDARLGNEHGSPGAPLQTPETEVGVRVYQYYQFRDIDCIDTSARPLRDHGVHYGLLSSSSCERDDAA